jgi:plasmid replication initiation protein
MLTSKENTIARLDNFLIYNGKFKLTAKEQKVVLFLVSKINPTEHKRQIEQVVSIKDLKEVLVGKKSGSFYDEIQNFASRLVKKGVEFRSDLEYEGRSLKGYRNWFQSIEPVRNEQGEVCLEFLFSEKLMPFLLELKEYTKIDYLETLPLGSSFSVRMYLIFRAHRDRMAKHQKRSKLRYEIGELKELLGVADKYDDYRNFKKFVVDVLVKEISKNTSIGVSWKPFKQGRSVAEIEFEFYDKGARSVKEDTLVENSMEFEKLTFAQERAFNRLVSYGVNDAIALDMIGKAVGYSELRGFEDWYMDECIKIVEAKSSMEGARAGVLVNWFLKTKVFDQPSNLSEILERLNARKKAQQAERPDAWENRLAARHMTAAEFRSQFKP